jgi:hypothetical protein
MRAIRTKGAIQFSWKHANVSLERMTSTFCITPGIEVYWHKGKMDYNTYSLGMFFLRYSAEVTIRLDNRK